jgi:23S rRNA pseudouridine1911/1915/1917 synthase
VSRGGRGPSVTRLRVPDAAAGERLDRFLAGLSEIGSRAVAERLLSGGGVLVDGRVRPKSHKLGGGEELEFEPPAARSSILEPQAMDLVVPYEDEHLLVVDKPAGLVVHPAPGHAKGTLVHGLLAYDVEGGEEPERPGIVHRLDRDTSGLLVVARSPEAHRRLQEQVQAREMTREYLALVVGRPRSRRGTIDAPIGRDRHDALRRSLDTDAPREALTHFEVEELLRRHSLLRVRLETGRTHQIRVHLAAIDLPVAGDAVYGRAGELGLERQFLHAARLAFAHPVTGERVDVSSPLPADLEAALGGARERSR